ncbi:hypothetical protein FB107DRAFT_280829 [Schizophyllum commune]
MFSSRFGYLFHLHMTFLDAYQINDNTELVKKLAKKYDAFLASEALIKQIPRLLDPRILEFTTTADFTGTVTQSPSTAIFERPATFLGKQRAHRRTRQRSRCSFAAPRAAAVGALASVHEARDPVRHPRESGTAAAALRRRWARPRAMASR